MIGKNFNNELFLYELVLVSDFNSISLYVTTICIHSLYGRTPLSNTIQCTYKGQSGVMKHHRKNPLLHMYGFLA